MPWVMCLPFVLIEITHGVNMFNILHIVVYEKNIEINDKMESKPCLRYVLLMKHKCILKIRRWFLFDI